MDIKINFRNSDYQSDRVYAHIYYRNRKAIAIIKRSKKRNSRGENQWTMQSIANLVFRSPDNKHIKQAVKSAIAISTTLDGLEIVKTC